MDFLLYVLTRWRRVCRGLFWRRRRRGNSGANAVNEEDPASLLSPEATDTQ